MHTSIYTMHAQTGKYAAGYHECKDELRKLIKNYKATKLVLNIFLHKSKVDAWIMNICSVLRKIVLRDKRQTSNNSLLIVNSLSLLLHVLIKLETREYIKHRMIGECCTMGITGEMNNDNCAEAFKSTNVMWQVETRKSQGKLFKKWTVSKRNLTTLASGQCMTSVNCNITLVI